MPGVLLIVGSSPPALNINFSLQVIRHIISKMNSQPYVILIQRNPLYQLVSIDQLIINSCKVIIGILVLEPADSHAMNQNVASYSLTNCFTKIISLKDDYPILKCLSCCPNKYMNQQNNRSVD